MFFLWGAVTVSISPPKPWKVKYPQWPPSFSHRSVLFLKFGLNRGNDDSLDLDLGWPFPSPCLSPDAFILQCTDSKARRPFLGVFLEVEAELLDFIKLPQTVCWGWDCVEMPQGYDLSSVSSPKQISNSSTSLSHHSTPHFFFFGGGGAWLEFDTC